MRYQTREIAKSSIVEYIECYYNRIRRHSTIAYNMPVLFEQNLLSMHDSVFGKLVQDQRVRL
ncbi:IS3 family transposase domain protein (plasmid) [Candidatus Trichorickettsia mobilis]|nr:IS3 family transposase domain protein [Candidatus Trichorickettsia mobilis]